MATTKPLPVVSGEKYLADLANDFDLDCHIDYAMWNRSYRVQFRTRDDPPKVASTYVTDEAMDEAASMQLLFDEVGNNLIAMLCSDKAETPCV